MRASGHTAVMANRSDPVDSLDFFPTPPWATRALCTHVLPGDLTKRTCWEPAAGEGHMAEVLTESFGAVHASDVHDYGRGYAAGSFVGIGADIANWPWPGRPDWIITNPPFNLALEFAERAVAEAGIGAALLVRVAWLEGASRYNRLFSKCPPATVALFSERVPMTKGRWDPEASTATAYCWVVWNRHSFRPTGPSSQLVWIPPGQRQRLAKPDDVRRFTEDAA